MSDLHLNRCLEYCSHPTQYWFKLPWNYCRQPWHVHPLKCSHVTPLFTRPKSRKPLLSCLVSPVMMYSRHTNCVIAPPEQKKQKQNIPQNRPPDPMRSVKPAEARLESVCIVIVLLLSFHNKTLAHTSMMLYRPHQMWGCGMMCTSLIHS